jgi:hypothetical protein
MKFTRLLLTPLLLVATHASAETVCIVSNSISPICGQRIDAPPSLIQDSAARQADTYTNRPPLKICSATDYPNCPAGTISESSVEAAVRAYDIVAKGSGSYHDCMDAGGYHGDCAHHLK